MQPSWRQIFSTSNNGKTRVDCDIDGDYKASFFDWLYIWHRKWDTVDFVRTHQRKYWNALTVGRGHDDDGCSCNHRAVSFAHWKSPLAVSRLQPFSRHFHWTYSLWRYCNELHPRKSLQQPIKWFVHVIPHSLLLVIYCLSTKDIYVFSMYIEGYIFVDCFCFMLYKWVYVYVTTGHKITKNANVKRL